MAELEEPKQETIGDWILGEWERLSKEKRAVFYELASKCKKGELELEEKVKREVREAKHKMSTMILNCVIIPEDKKKHLNEFMKSFSEYSEYTQGVLYVIALNDQFNALNGDDVGRMLIRMYRMVMFTNDSLRLGIEWCYRNYMIYQIFEDKDVPELFFCHSLLVEGIGVVKNVKAAVARSDK